MILRILHGFFWVWGVQRFGGIAVVPDLSLAFPRLSSVKSGNPKRPVVIPHALDDGFVFFMEVVPLQTDDACYHSLLKIDWAPGGIFVVSNSGTSRWSSRTGKFGSDLSCTNRRRSVQFKSFH